VNDLNRKAFAEIEALGALVEKLDIVIGIGESMIGKSRRSIRNAQIALRLDPDDPRASLMRVMIETMSARADETERAIEVEISKRAEYLRDIERLQCAMERTVQG